MGLPKSLAENKVPVFMQRFRNSTLFILESLTVLPRRATALQEDYSEDDSLPKEKSLSNRNQQERIFQIHCKN